MRETVAEVRGQRLRVMEAGEGPILLFFHGASGLSWTPVLELLSRDWRVFAPEHPGFGRSQIPDWMMSVGDLAFFYLDMLETLGLRDVKVVGHSLGGWIAAEIAVRNTARLDAMALLAPAGVASDVPFGDIFLWTPEANARHQFYDPALAEQRLKAQAALDLDVVLQNKAAVARLAWSPRLHNPQLPHWLHRIDIRTLLVWGENDEIVPPACHEAFLREIPGAELIALPKTGHALQIENADEVARRVTAFFRGAQR
jgi:pimeloyl-ACP methyl ester carboxylesterase